jgi:hypothetical protein
VCAPMFQHPAGHGLAAAAAAACAGLQLQLMEHVQGVREHFVRDPGCCSNVPKLKRGGR